MADIPTGAKVVAILYYISAAISVLVGLLFLIGGSFIGAILGASMEGFEALGAGIFVGIGIVAIAVAVLEFFIARGIWALKNWARIVAIIFGILGFLGALGTITTLNGIISLIFNGVILYFLLIDKPTKAAFA